MRTFVLALTASLLFTGCDSRRVYEQNYDQSSAQWLVGDSIRFSFSIPDTSGRYNIICNLRNTNAYPYSRIFIQYALTDSLRQSAERQMISGYLFDPRTGKPEGRSGIGDIFSHRFALLKAYHFHVAGSYELAITQMMRTDTLQGIVSVGLRVEKAPVTEP